MEEIMNYYKNNNNEIFAYDDTQTPLDGLVSITEAEKDAILLAKDNEHKQTVEYRLSEAKHYLASTDWIIVKISEMQIEGSDVTSLKEKYKEELINRTFYRNLINQLEE